MKIEKARGNRAFCFSVKIFYLDIPPNSKITFMSNQNRLVEVFRRLKYNGFLFETWTGIRNWLCNNFLYLSKT